MGLWATYRDHRGERLPAGGLLSARRARAAGIAEATIDAALWPAERLAGRHGMAAGLVIAACWGAAALALPDAGIWARAAAAVGLSLVITAPLGVRNRRRIVALFEQGWLTRGLCPACGASVADVAIQSDGCRVCAACGSAWKFDADAITAQAGRGARADAGPGERVARPFLGPPIADDRGRPYAFDRAIPALRARGMGIDPRRIRAAMGFSTPEQHVALYAGVACILVVSIGVFGEARDAPRWIIAALLAAIPAIAFVLAMTALRPWSAHVRRRASRRLGLCAACGRSVATIDPEEDGCRVCAWCGGAWRVEM